MKIRTLIDWLRIMYILEPSYPKWATAKSGELNAPRKRELREDKSVIWRIGEESGEVADHIEMSGFASSSIISYGKDESGKLLLCVHLAVPALRLTPNNTSATYSHNFYPSAGVFVDGEPVVEKPREVSIRGKLDMTSDIHGGEITRSFTPAVRGAALVERVKVRRAGEIRVTADEPVFRQEENTLEGVYVSEVQLYDVDGVRREEIVGRDELEFYRAYVSRKESEVVEIDCAGERRAREDFIEKIFGGMTLESGNSEIDALFSHSLLRGAESIFDTPSGYMHSPGGGTYYYAMWTNDQCEYANPFFAYLDYDAAREQAVNCYTLFARHMDKSATPYAAKEPLVSSIICGGSGYWNDAGDRGDGAMYGYGLARYLLASGDRELARSMWGNLEWAVEFELSRKNKHGVITSDRDELEGRFPSGKANLFTSCLTYDMLDKAAIIAKELGMITLSEKYIVERNALRLNIERYFGAKVQGYRTYRYFKGNRCLRSWICMPLTVGIYDRAEGTVAALFGVKLYRDTLLRTSSRSKVTWDRSLLFAMRGALAAGYVDKGLEILGEYTRSRLLGAHVPYPFEAFPEGNRRHLAAESILYARVVTEGLLGLEPLGFDRMGVTPRRKEGMRNYALRGLKAYGRKFDIEVGENSLAIVSHGKRYETGDGGGSAVFDFAEMRFI